MKKMNTDRDERMIGGDEEWGRNIIALPGSYHREMGLKCQAQALCRCKGSKEVMLVADGSGSDDINVVCVERILGILAEYMLDHFDEICRKENRKCADAILLTAIKVIGTMMEKENRKKEDLGSTLMGVCIDKESNRFCYVHLGDGIIAYGKKDDENEKQRVSILSRPVNGRESNQRMFTTSDRAGQMIKLSSGRLKGITGFMLLTDGVYNERWGSFSIEKMFVKVCKGSIRMVENQNDQCVAAIFRR